MVMQSILANKEAHIEKIRYLPPACKRPQANGWVSVTREGVRPRCAKDLFCRSLNVVRVSAFSGTGMHNGVGLCCILLPF